MLFINFFFWGDLVFFVKEKNKIKYMYEMLYYFWIVRILNG